MAVSTPVTNLNDLTIREDYQDKKPLSDHSIIRDTDTEVYFRDLAGHLIQHIDQAECVLGCVAWLTNRDVMKALLKKYVSIVVQKEDLWRPDVIFDNSKNPQSQSSRIQGRKASQMRRIYERIIDKCSMERYSFSDSIISSLNVCGDPSLDAIRCLGNHNSVKKPASPRMHNKFLLFADFDENDQVKPYGVWTGSFNVTYNAGCSFENAVYLTEPDIVNAYYHEYAQIVALSEPLDWESEWCQPEYRIGT